MNSLPLIAVGVWFIGFGMYCLIRRRTALAEWVRWYNTYPFIAHLMPFLLGIGAVGLLLLGGYMYLNTFPTGRLLSVLATAIALGIGAITFRKAIAELEKLMRWLIAHPRMYGAAWIGIGICFVLIGLFLSFGNSRL